MCWYANDYRRIFQHLPRRLRTRNFLLCDRDCSESPLHVYAVAKSRSIEHDKNRTVTVVPVNVGRHFKDVSRALSDKYPLEKKLPFVFWRGATTSSCWERGDTHTSSEANPACARWNLVVRWTMANSSMVDVGISKLVQLSSEMENIFARYLKNDASLQDMLKFRYLISVEGNDVATNLKWALASNSVVFMPPPTRESIILESTLIPWVHFVPLKYDMSELKRSVFSARQT